jgi:monoterpene epsilon-lactone hydrolase
MRSAFRWMVHAVLAAPILVFGQGALPRLCVPSRDVPVPTTISPVLQKHLSSPIPPLTEPPTTTEGWKKLRQETDAPTEKLVRAAAKLMLMKVEAWEVAGVKCYSLTPKKIAPGKEDYLLVHVHGGSYVFNGGMAATGEAALLAEACKMRAISIDYRMPPEQPFPAATDDVLAVWKAVLTNYDPKKVVMAGTSAGGGLVMTTMLRCKVCKLAMPAALFIGTPAADLSKTGDSLYVNAEVDNCLGRYEGLLEASFRLYAGNRDLKDPLLSPIYGNFSGWPPTILVSGTRDLFLSQTVRTHRKLRAACVPAELHVFEGMSHADYLTSFPAPESREALAEIARFFDQQLRK